MLQIDETTVGEHFDLEPSDLCYYVWEYTAGQRYDFSPTNQLIANLKIKPSQIAANPNRAYYKQQAISHSSAALRSLIRQRWIEQAGTFVPMPGSKIPGNPEYDDRILKILQTSFGGFHADIRPLLEQAVNTAADHESSERMSYKELRAITQISATASAAAPRANIAVVDDVLNSGKHFKVAQELLSARFPGTPIIGIFLARCVHPNPFAAEPAPRVRS